MQVVSLSTKIDLLVKEIGLRFGRTEEEINTTIQVLQNNWITSLENWHLLSESKKKELHLPILLANCLDQLSWQATSSSHKYKVDVRNTIASNSGQGTITTFPKVSTSSTPPQYFRRIQVGLLLLRQQQWSHPRCGDRRQSLRTYTSWYKHSHLLAVMPSCNSYQFCAPTERLDALLQQLGGGQLFTEAPVGGKRAQVHPSTLVRYALVPGRLLETSNRRYLIRPDGPFKGRTFNSRLFWLVSSFAHHMLGPFLLQFKSNKSAIDNWLKGLGMEKYSPLFAKHGIDDFLVLPFLRPSVLEDMGVTCAYDRSQITRAVKHLQDATSYECKLSETIPPHFFAN